MHGRYLTPGDLAALCDVDTKTIRDWANRRGLPHVRTPGRQRRFKPHEVVPWLRKRGYSVPRILVVAAKLGAVAEAEAAEAEADASAERAAPETGDFRPKRGPNGFSRSAGARAATAGKRRSGA